MEKKWQTEFSYIYIYIYISVQMEMNPTLCIYKNMKIKRIPEDEFIVEFSAYVECFGFYIKSSSGHYYVMLFSLNNIQFLKWNEKKNLSILLLWVVFCFKWLWHNLSSRFILRWNVFVMDFKNFLELFKNF